VSRAPRILFVAGDPSGDQHAAAVARAIKARDPGVQIEAVGGAALRSVADVFLHDLVGESVMGFIEPLAKIPRFWRLYRTVVAPAAARADVVVPTDFYGFNRYVAAKAKSAGKKVLYLISPQVWASRPGRMETLKNCVDRMLVIFPFEEELYRSRGIPATFVGHPYLDSLPAVPEEPPRNAEPVVGLLPGSRPSVVRRHLPLFLKAAAILSAEKVAGRFLLFAAPNLSDDFYKGLVGPRALCPLEIVRDGDYRLRQTLDLAITCSGSATLENALLGVPMVVVYKTSWLTYQLAKRLVQVDRIAMANILAGRDLVPELIQDQATPENMAAEARSLLQDASRLGSLREDLLFLRSKLGGPGFAQKAAEEILKTYVRN
jgi:lipid-A-disaccharide synthase